MAENKSQQFEKSLDELSKLVEKLEKGELSLDESLKQFEKGVKLSQQCQDLLQKAEQKINALSPDNNE